MYLEPLLPYRPALKPALILLLFSFFLNEAYSQNSLLASDDSYSTSINTPISFNPLENDFDPEGDPFFLSTAVSYPLNGMISLNSDFTIEYLPNMDFCGTDMFTYSIIDDQGAMDTATVSITVTCGPDTGINNAPNAGPDIYICALPIITNVVCISPTDPDGDNLNICHFEVLFECTVDIVNDTCIQFAALPASAGLNELQIVVCDDGDPMLTDTMSYFINLDCAAPIVLPDVVSISESISTVNGSEVPLIDNTIEINVLENDSDECDYNLELNLIANGPLNGEAVINGSIIEYTYDDGFTGTDQFQYFVCNECGECDFSTVSINVQPPCSEAYNFCVEESQMTELCLDLCQGEFSLLSALSTSGVNVSIESNECIMYESGSAAIDIVDISAIDINGDSFTAALSIEVSMSCLPLMVNNDTAFIASVVSTTLDVLSNDQNTADNIPSIVSTLGNGIATVNPDGSITYLPNPGFTGLEIIEYELCDDLGSCMTAQLVIVVLSNQEPLATDDSVATFIEVPVQISVLDNDIDPEGDALSINSVTDPLNGTAIVFNDNIIYTPNPGFIGLDFMSYELCDVNDNCDQGYILINVLEAIEDLPPVFTGQNTTFTGALGDSIHFCFEAVDPESGEVSYTLDSSVTIQTISIDDENNCITYFITENVSSSESVEITACDESDNCDTQTITFESAYLSLFIDLEDDVISNEDSGEVILSILENDSIPDDFTLHFPTEINSGTLELIDNSLVYIAYGEVSTLDTFSYVLCNVLNECDSAEVVLLSGPLSAVNDTIIITDDSQIEISVLDNDVNGIPIRLEAVEDADYGSVESYMASGIINYDPDSMNDAVFNYTIIDDITGELSASASVLIWNRIEDEMDCDILTNAFSPNDDGINDTFIIKDLDICYPNALVSIYNRWGELVYSDYSDGDSFEWDGEDEHIGELVTAGTYYLLLEAEGNILKSSFLQVLR